MGVPALGVGAGPVEDMLWVWLTPRPNELSGRSQLLETITTLARGIVGRVFPAIMRGSTLEVDTIAGLVHTALEPHVQLSLDAQWKTARGSL